MNHIVEMGYRILGVVRGYVGLKCLSEERLERRMEKGGRKRRGRRRASRGCI